MLESEQRRKNSEEMNAAKLKRLEASKRKDEYLFFNTPNQQADFRLWAKADYWTADEAVALSFGRNPEKVNWKFVYEFTLISPFAKEYEARRKMVQRACKSGGLSKRIVPIQFLRWAAIKAIGCPDELASLVPHYDASKRKKGLKNIPNITEEDERHNSSSEFSGVQKSDECPFDPLPINGIAEIFKLDTDSKVNLGKWRNFARQAKRNGLTACRKSKGIGRGKSIFDPMMIANWLVSRGIIAQERAYRCLANNLPPRSNHLKDTFAQQ